jgi:hypothetical protein
MVQQRDYRYKGEVLSIVLKWNSVYLTNNYYAVCVVDLERVGGCESLVAVSRH